jgi:hypothetical protein
MAETPGPGIRLDRIVAIKTLRTDLARDQIFQARFRREARPRLRSTIRPSWRSTTPART